MSGVQVSFPKPGVGHVLMDKPAVFNAFDEDMIAGLDDAFARLAVDPQVRAIVLAGSGKHFSAGADLQWMRRAAAADHAWNLADARRFAAMLSRIDRCPKPTVAAVQGAALGGGVGLACACDIAIASMSATFSVSEARFGILPAVIGPYVINAVGPRQARRLALTTTRIGAEEALRIGIVQQVVAPDRLESAVQSAVGELLQAGPQAQAEIKSLFAQLPVGPVTEQVGELTAGVIARVRGSDEAREGFDAFLAKRRANWVPQ